MRADLAALLEDVDIFGGQRGATGPTPAFCKKRLQAVENKGNERKKEGKETTKRLQVSENMGFATKAPRPRSLERELWRGYVHPRGDGATGRLLGLHICWTTGFADWTNLLAVGHEVLSNALRLPGGTP